MKRFLQETWWLTAEMAPYLLLGFVVAGLLRFFFNEDWVKRHLGKKGFRQIFKAVIIGVPLPLCSCGVIPVAAAIRRQGGERGAVAAFTASTPQTGVDAIAATIGLLGWVFAGVRVLIAFVNGILAGLVVERWGDPAPGKPDASAVSCGNEGTDSPCCVSNGASSKTSQQSAPIPVKDRLASGLRFGLITLPGDLFGALVLGLVLAGLIATFVPGDFFTDLPGGLFGVYLGMTLVSLPLYVCSTGSIPMAFTFLSAGMSPGGVLIFLIAGPASNTATVTALWKMIGPRGTIGYLLSIVATAWIAAAILDFSGLGLFVTGTVLEHETGLGRFQSVMGILLVAVLLYSRAAVFRSSR